MCDNVTKFVLEVEKYPCLYNHTIADYSRKDITERAWSEISKEVNWTGMYKNIV